MGRLSTSSAPVYHCPGSSWPFGFVPWATAMCPSKYSPCSQAERSLWGCCVGQMMLQTCSSAPVYVCLCEYDLFWSVGLLTPKCKAFSTLVFAHFKVRICVQAALMDHLWRVSASLCIYFIITQNFTDPSCAWSEECVTSSLPALSVARYVSSEKFIRFGEAEANEWRRRCAP